MLPPFPASVSFWTVESTICMPLAVTVFPVSVKVSAPPVPVTLDLVVRRGGRAIDENAVRYRAAIRQNDGHAVGLQGRQIDLDRIRGNERLVAQNGLGDIVEDLDIVPAEANGHVAAGGRVDRNFCWYEPITTVMFVGPMVTVRPCESLIVAWNAGEVFNWLLDGVQEKVAALSKVMPAGILTGVTVIVSPAGALVSTV